VPFPDAPPEVPPQIPASSAEPVVERPAIGPDAWPTVDLAESPVPTVVGLPELPELPEPPELPEVPPDGVAVVEPQPEMVEPEPEPVAVVEPDPEPQPEVVAPRPTPTPTPAWNITAPDGYTSRPPVAWPPRAGAAASPRAESGYVRPDQGSAA